MLNILKTTYQVLSIGISLPGRYSVSFVLWIRYPVLFPFQVRFSEVVLQPFPTTIVVSSGQKTTKHLRQMRCAPSNSVRPSPVMMSGTRRLACIFAQIFVVPLTGNYWLNLILPWCLSLQHLTENIGVSQETLRMSGQTVMGGLKWTDWRLSLFRKSTFLRLAVFDIL